MESETIERVVFRGGPCDGTRMAVLGKDDLVDRLSIPTDQNRDGVVYLKSGDYEQLIGLHMSEPYWRHWFYDWQPEPD